MKKKVNALFILTLLSIMSVHTQAQEAFKAIYETKGHYIREWAERGRSAPTVLEIHPDRTFFYDMARLASDSTLYVTLQETQDTQKAIHEALKMNNRSLEVMIRSVFETGRREVTQAIHFDYHTYTEPMERIDWQIDDTVTETKSGYPCHPATATFLGRRWTAWYTPEVPTPAGPWKLWGLPGLIVEASEAEGLFAFSLSSFEKLNPEESQEGFKKYMSIGEVKEGRRKDILRLLGLYFGDPASFLRMRYPGQQVILEDGEGKSLTPEEIRSKVAHIEQ